MAEAFTLSTFFKQYFSRPVQKIPVDAGFTCPNRNPANRNKGGCAYCSIEGFSPSYVHAEDSIEEQLRKGIAFFSRKTKPETAYLAYFQSYTNTYQDFDLLKKIYEKALNVKEVKGLVIGTRPDCVTPEVLALLKELSKKTFALVELGLESTYDKALKRVNRGHSYADSVKAVNDLSALKIPIGIHLILGLPGISRKENMAEAEEINKLPVQLIKLHQLQILKGTIMERDFKLFPEQYDLFEMNEYVNFVAEFCARLRRDIAIDRFFSEVPAQRLIAPKWGANPAALHLKIKNAIAARLNGEDFWIRKDFPVNY